MSGTQQFIRTLRFVHRTVKIVTVNATSHCRQRSGLRAQFKNEEIGLVGYVLDRKRESLAGLFAM